MNVVIQSNYQHALTRKEVESMICIFPEKWGKHVKTIAFYQGVEPAITIQFYKKKQTLGVLSPKEFNSKEARAEAVQKIVIGLEYIAENDDLPRNLTKSVRTSLIETTDQIRKQCIKLINKDDV